MNPKAGLTFAGALRSILRQDPDVVLVGEMRDPETAQIGIKAALTGHLVLSTLHTNDAPSARHAPDGHGHRPVPGRPAPSTACSPSASARRLCKRLQGALSSRREAQLLAAGLDVEDLAELPDALPHRRLRELLADTGYRGRLAIHEVMIVTEEIERLIVETASTDDIAQAARVQGMRTLREDGIAKVLLGQTTFEEIARVVV